MRSGKGLSRRRIENWQSWIFDLHRVGLKQKAPSLRQGPGGRKNEVLEETITCAVNRFDILRRIFIFAKLLSQPLYVYIHGAVGDINLLAPNALEDFLATEHIVPT